MSSSYHKCNKALDDATYTLQTAAEIERLCSRINDAAVCKHASSLNGGRSCTIEHSSTIGPGALMGSANYHARIRFHDGSPSWLLRIPRVASFAVGLPSSLVEYLVLSEYATLKFLETTAVPAPRVFSYGICGTETDHGTGVSFILMEELRGTPWTGQGVSGGKASENEKAKVWSGLADILMQLEKHTLFLKLVLCPFATSTAYYAAFAEHYLELIVDGQLYTEYPIDAYLVYQENQTTERFYLKHVDDKGDHLLVDEQLNITGVIDWQMARIVPRREAFGPSLVTADMNALCNGKFSLSPDDLVLADMLRKRGLSDLASNMIDEKVRRFFLGLALEPEWKYALPLANAILKAFGAVEGWSQWKESALKEYETDERLKGLIGRSSQMG
ncbi:hypothetical protein LHYA1_G004046 [Lachnellula hyalina]|uniref:Aminoglycoside phosphotransferase domain-containing protein n=1 Tax=Lachnellula hyalina TaxID=1316788 RepID=A0A8H8U211_9HELO|nr:uncharacterized protein LHYA1_G004046 [Lachnellula hyalina]TVY27596.1 hypothetical protein LHYA1_G004046 [Lachnellula hyalina]